jgi:hypothetical protein
MNTKHKPATALPWSVAGFSTSRVRGVHAASGKLRNVADFVEYVGDKGEDAAYATHAANAYPKLVEALRGILQGDGASWATRATVARDLLRELGEAE